MALLTITDFDRSFYTDRIEPFIPEKLIDIHTHVWQKDETPKPVVDPADLQANAWPALVAEDNPISDLTETYRLLFPGKTVTPLMFGMPGALTDSIEDQENLGRSNTYVELKAREHSFPSLLLTHPSWTADELEQRLTDGNHCGAKVYLDMAPAYLPRNELRIFDFLTPSHLDILNKLGKIVMLHIPRPDRLRDPVNLFQMLEIEHKWPHARVIIAHVGRAYCDEDVGNAFDVLKGTRRMMFDFSANTNQMVFEKLIDTVGPDRILFGSDLPILRMRTKRICEKGSYVNLVPKGLYDGIRSYAHMREVPYPEAEEITFFLYEEIDAFRRAAERANLNTDDVKAIFYGNAASLLKETS